MCRVSFRAHVKYSHIISCHIRILTEVMISWRNLNGGFWSSLSVNGGFLTTRPRLSCVFLIIFASTCFSPPLSPIVNGWQRTVGQKSTLKPHNIITTFHKYVSKEHKHRSEFHPIILSVVSAEIIKIVFRSKSKTIFQIFWKLSRRIYLDM